MEHAQGNNLPNQLAFLDNNADIVMACLVVGILILMVMPLPAFILDLLLSLNITCAIIILLAPARRAR